MPAINPLKPEFNLDYRGILSVPASAFELKKVFLSGFFAIIALIFYNIFTYLALWMDGSSVSETFASQSILPFWISSLESLFSTIIYTAGIVISVFVLMFSSLAVGIINIEELRGNRLCSARDGLRFALNRIGNMIYSPLAMLAFSIVLILLMSILGALGRILFIGESIFAILFVVPGFVFALIVLLITVLLVLSILVTPAVTSADRDGETFTTILETFSTVIRKPFHWSAYTVFTLICAKALSWLLAMFSLVSVSLLLKIAAWSGGSGVADSAGRGFAHLPLDSPAAAFITHLWANTNGWEWLNIGIDTNLWMSPGEMTTSSLLMAGSFLVILFYIVGYGLSIVYTGQAYIYVVIKNLRDDYDITAEEPLLMAEEWINPPIDESSREFSSRSHKEGSGKSVDDPNIDSTEEDEDKHYESEY